MDLARAGQTHPQPQVGYGVWGADIAVISMQHAVKLPAHPEAGSLEALEAAALADCAPEQ